MSQKTGLSKIRLFSYVVIEKLIDFIFFVLLFLIIIITSAVVVENVLIVSAAIITVITVGLFLFLRFNGLILLVVDRFVSESIYSRIESFNRELLDGIYLFRSFRQVGKSCVYFLGAWTCIAVIFYLVSWPFLGPLHLPAYAPLILMVFSALSLAIPSAPSAVGTMHFAFLMAIRLMADGSYDINLAAGFTVVLHFFIILYDFVVGAALLGMYNMNNARTAR